MNFMSELEKGIAEKPAPKPVLPPKNRGDKVNPDPQHIIEMRAENVKRLTAVHIVPDKHVVILSGDNGAGKSSVLDGIEMTFTGGRNELEKPVRLGKDRAFDCITTEDFVIRRVWTDGGKSSYLEITDRNGVEFTSPQTLLNKFVSKVCIDPLAFTQMDAKKQAEELMKIYPPIDCNGNPFNLGENKRAIECATEARREADYNVKQRRIDFERLRNVPDTGPEPVDVKAMSARLKELQNLGRSKNTAVAALNMWTATRDRLKRELEQAEKMVCECSVAVNECQDPSAEIEALQKQIEDASEINATAANIAEKRRVLEEGRAAAKAFKDAESRVEELKHERKAAFKRIVYPVDGLEINDENALIYNGIPIAQCATSEKIRIGVALGAAAQPVFRIAFIRDGSLLDNNSMEIVRELAKEFNMQFWIERVSDGSPAAIQIVEGSNIGAVDADGKPGKKSSDPFGE